MYKTEAHVHTMEVSKCGKTPAREIVRLYSELGFDTIFITDHINSATFDRWGDIPWEEKIDIFLSGYETARDEGNKIGLRVLYGAEICFKKPEGCCNDYLVYGIDRDFLLGMENLNHGSLEDFYPYAKDHGVTIIQAHPYRGHACYPTPDFVDGFEVYNAHPRHENFNDEALALVSGRDCLATVGSDVHMACDVGRAYILTEEPIKTAEDYINALKSRKARFVTPEGMAQ